MISNFRTSYTLKRRALALRFNQFFLGEHMRLHWKVELEFESSQPGGYSRKTRFLGRYSAVSVLKTFQSATFCRSSRISASFSFSSAVRFSSLYCDHHVDLPDRLLPSVIFLDPCSIAWLCRIDIKAIGTAAGSFSCGGRSGGWASTNRLAVFADSQQILTYSGGNGFLLAKEQIKLLMKLD